MDEVLFEGRGARITTAKVVLGGTTYPLAGITSVSTAVESPSPLFAFVLGIPGATAALVGGGTVATALLCNVDDVRATAVLGAVILGIGVVLLGAAVLSVWGASARHYVVIGTSGGDKRALVTSDPAFAGEVREAIEQAISRRG